MLDMWLLAVYQWIAKASHISCVNSMASGIQTSERVCIHLFLFESLSHSKSCAVV